MFLSAAGSALAQSAMTQQQYILWMANVCGDALPSTSSGDDLVNWARGKGMNPTAGWQLGEKLTKQVMAQTLVQLLNLAPRKGTFDAIRILEREGIVLQSTGDVITIRNFVAAIDSGFLISAKPGLGWGDKGHDHIGPPGRADDDSFTPHVPRGNPGGGPDATTPSSSRGNGRGNRH